MEVTKRFEFHLFLNHVASISRHEGKCSAHCGRFFSKRKSNVSLNSFTDNQKQST